MESTKSLAATRSGNASVESYRSKFVSSPLPRTKQNSRCVTVKQVITACNSRKQEGRFVLTNSLIYTVRLCGRIVCIDQNEGYTDYVLDDGTGLLKGRTWENSKKGKTDLSGSTINAYYVIISNVVTHHGEILLQTLKAAKINDHNTITMHFLAAIQEECELAHMYIKGSRLWEQTKHDFTKASVNNQFSTELDKEAIVDLLSKSDIRDSEAGATTEYILRELHIDLLTGRSTLQQMLDEGSIYNTRDYDHYKLADEY